MASNIISILIKAKDEASSTLRQFGKEAENADDKSSKLSAAVGKFGKYAATTAKVGLAAMVTGTVAASKAAWDQVSSVQQATVALNAYEKDGSKVNKVLKDLVNYARSDMGVLFQRQDLFGAAQGLKVMGAETENLTDYVKIMSRSVGLGLTTFDDLGRVIGRVGSTGRLTGIDFDMLTKAGYQLDDSLRNTNVTWEQLFRHLDKGIPADAMAGQADTIRGRLVRLQSAFRDVGLRVLGVNDDLNGFISGGIGDRLLGALETARNALRSLSPHIETLIQNFLATGDAVMARLRPGLASLASSVQNTLLPAIQSLVTSQFAHFIGNVAVAALQGLIGALNGAVNVAKPLLSTIQAFGPMTLGAVAAVYAYNSAIAAKAAIVKIAAAAQTALNVAMRANPAMWLVAIIGALGAGLMALTSQTDRTKSANDRLKQAQDAVRQSSENLRNAQLELKNAQLDAEGSALRVERAQKTYNDTVRQYGPASLEAREAEHQLRRAKDEQTAATNRVKDATNSERDAMQRLARDNSAQQFAIRTSGSMQQVTGSMQTQMRTTDVLKDRLGKLNGTNVRYQVNGNADGQISAMDQLRQRIRGIDGMSVSYRINSYETKQAATGTGVPYKKNAVGTNYSPGGLTLVGERGPELVNLPRGSQVTQAYRTHAVLSQSQPSQVIVNITGPVNFNERSDIDYFAERINKTQRLAKVGMA